MFYFSSSLTQHHPVTLNTPFVTHKSGKEEIIEIVDDEVRERGGEVGKRRRRGARSKL